MAMAAGTITTTGMDMTMTRAMSMDTMSMHCMGETMDGTMDLATASMAMTATTAMVMMRRNLVMMTMTVDMATCMTTATHCMVMAMEWATGTSMMLKRRIATGYHPMCTS